MLETDKIQGLLFSAYQRHLSAMYLFLSIPEKEGARERAQAWLRQVTPLVTTGPRAGSLDRERNFSLNLAFTYPGLQKLGLGERTLATFSGPFIQGMSEKNRARLLADTPAGWAWGQPGHRIHFLLMLFGNNREIDSQKQRQQMLEWQNLVKREQERALTVGGLLPSFDPILSEDLPEEQEHFGFEDGIGQPKIREYRPEKHQNEHPDNVIKAGEFILGYENEYDYKTESPTLQPPDSDPSLPDGDFGRNGTYLVLRQLEQDVAGFWKMLEKQCRRPDGSPDREQEDALAAKMIGRHRDGRPLALGYQTGAPKNDFRYFPEDQYGYGCPMGAHVRRANPRDSLLGQSGHSIKISKRHRLLRRGRPYGPLIQNRQEDDKQKRGLVFITLDGNIERQFEFVQHTWISSPDFAGLYDEADPILGGRTRETGLFTIPQQPVRERRHGILSHITVKGGAYFFLPSVPALQYLCR